MLDPSDDQGVMRVYDVLLGYLRTTERRGYEWIEPLANHSRLGTGVGISFRIASTSYRTKIKFQVNVELSFKKGTIIP